MGLSVVAFNAFYWALLGTSSYEEEVWEQTHTTFLFISFNELMLDLTQIPPHKLLRKAIKCENFDHNFLPRSLTLHVR